MNWFKRQTKPSIQIIASEDKQLFRQQIKETEELAKIPGPSNFRMAVLEFDKLLDAILKKMEVGGEGVGDRLKNIGGLIDDSAYQKLWSAHKVRNKLAHDSGNEIMSWEAKEAINDYLSGLNKLLSR